MWAPLADEACDVKSGAAPASLHFHRAEALDLAQDHPHASHRGFCFPQCPRESGGERGLHRISAAQSDPPTGFGLGMPLAFETRLFLRVTPFMQSRFKIRLLTALFGVVWLVLVAFGVRVLLNYESAPGDAGALPREWPAQSRIQRSGERATLVMMAHPHCPCTRASIGELAELMASVQGKVSACVLFFKPLDSSEDWEKTDLWESAAAIPGVTVLADADGQEAHRFNIETSGHTLLFDAAGHLLFSGGITASRGHAGDNVGTSAIASLLLDGASVRNNTPVFGCTLFDPKKPTTKISAMAWLK